MTSEAAQKTISFGVLLFPGYQLLDAAGPMDLINMHSDFALLNFYDPSGALAKKAFAIQWHFISVTGTLDPITPTSGPPQTPTATFETCPHLGYLLVPGTDPRVKLSEECITFIQTRFAEAKGLLTVCSGSLAIAQTGILDGLQVATNKFVLGKLISFGLTDAEKKVNWVGDKRFVVDGKVWSAAGMTSGLDLAAEWVRVHVDPEIVKYSRDASEYTPIPAQPDAFAYVLDGVNLKPE